MFYFIDTDWIPKTDDREERIQIGMEIERKNPQLYTEQLVKRIWEPINKYCSERTEEQKRNLYYMSLYDYWVFGISIEEEIYLNLETKTDEERSEYITDRNRWNYYPYHLSLGSHCLQCGSKACVRKALYYAVSA